MVLTDLSARKRRYHQILSFLVFVPVVLILFDDGFVCAVLFWVVVHSGERTLSCASHLELILKWNHLTVLDSYLVEGGLRVYWAVQLAVLSRLWQNVTFLSRTSLHTLLKINFYAMYCT